MTSVEVNQIFRAQLARILASSEFSSSRHLSDFLSYASECAFEGRTHLDQVDIAGRVLDRPDFNPLEDATVRKLATHLRQRLERYYAGPGVNDEVRVVLPVRSYIPRYEQIARAPTPPITTPLKANASRRLWPWAVALAVMALAAITVALWQKADDGVTEIVTARGDIVGRINDAAGDAVRLGPSLQQEDEVSVRLVFTAEREAQQAGILVWQDADNFLRLGRKFVGRNMLEFDVERNGVLQATPASHVFEADAQDGSPIWLSLRRSGADFSAFSSRDGQTWRRVGSAMRFDAPNLKAGIYALNGRRDAPGIPARFDHFAKGPSFMHWTQSEHLPANGLTYATNCATGNAPAWSLLDQSLVIAPALGSARCSAVMWRALDQSDRDFRTLLDFLPTAEVGAGLFIRGSKGRYRLVRHELNGAAISWIQEGVNVDGARDFPGSPAVHLRIRLRNGQIVAGFSRDDRHYHEFPAIPRHSLGQNLQVGVGTFINDIAPAQPYPPPKFRFFHEEPADLRRP